MRVNQMTYYYTQREILLGFGQSFKFVEVATYRRSHRRCSVRKNVFRNLTKFTARHLCHSLFFNKVAGLRPALLSQNRRWNRCFPVNFAKLLRTAFLQNTSSGCFCTSNISTEAIFCSIIVALTHFIPLAFSYTP